MPALIQIEDNFVNEALLVVVPLVLTIVLIFMCMKRKSQKRPNNDVQLVSLKYSDDQDNFSGSPKKPEVTNGNTKEINNGINIEPQQRPHSLSSASTPNENRTLPNIPHDKVAKRHSSPLVSPNTNAVKSVVPLKSSASTRDPASTSPKNRRLPELPLASGSKSSYSGSKGSNHDLSVSSKDGAPQDNALENEGTYESLENPATPQDTLRKTNADDGPLYDMVSEVSDDTKQDENDLYAQVGDDLSTDVNTSLNTTTTDNDTGEQVASTSAQLSELDDVVTYASIDKTKKMSIRKSSPPVSIVPSPPPIPTRNFDVDEMSEVDSASQTGTMGSRTGSTQAEGDSASLENGQRSLHAGPGGDVEVVNESLQQSSPNGPAYDTLCVRESFAHQRLREEVAENQRNRYANMQQTPEVYAQIDEAVYESVSQPNSGDGTFQPRQMDEDDYSSIDAVNSSVENNPTTISTNHNSNNIHYQNSFYENVDCS